MAMASEQERERKLRKESLLGAAGIKVGVYRGSHVAVRMVVRKHVEVNRALKKALMMRKEMNHENINRFIGACIDLPRVYIVSQFCSRHSLQVSGAQPASAIIKTPFSREHKARYSESQLGVFLTPGSLLAQQGFFMISGHLEERRFASR